MRQLALETLAQEKTEIIKFTDVQVDEKPTRVQSEFYSQALYESKLLAEILPALAIPPPVYHPGDQPVRSEKLDSPTSSNSSDSELASPAPSYFWDGYQDDVLPPKTHGKLFRNLRHQIFSLYRRLFGIVFIVNMAILVSIFAKGGANAQELGLIVVANLFCAILMRQDYIINAFFTTFCAVPTS